MRPNPLDPFVIADDADVIGLSRFALGEPIGVKFSSPPLFVEMSWDYAENGMYTTILVSHKIGNKTLEISVSNHMPDAYGIRLVSSGAFIATEAHERLSGFVEMVRKPWEEWTEEEIMAEPMWICLCGEQNGPITHAMHAMMTMESYLKPNNKWIKRYFEKSRP